MNQRIGTISVDNAIRELCARGMGKLNSRQLHCIKKIKNSSKLCQGEKHWKPFEETKDSQRPRAEFKVTFCMGSYMYEYRKYFSVYLCAECLNEAKDSVKRYVSSCINMAFEIENNL